MDKVISNLKAIRKARGYTQRELAQAISIDQTIYSKYECGWSMPYLSTAIRIAKFLRCSVEDIWPVQ